MSKSKGKFSYEIRFTGDVPYEGCGEAVGYIMANSLDMAVKYVITMLGVHLGLQLTKVKSDDKDICILGAVGQHDHNFTVRVEEINLIVEPPRKGKKR